MTSSKISINIQKENTNYIDKAINKIHKLYSDDLKEFLVNKVLLTLEKVIIQRTTMFNTDNDKYLNDYKNNNKVMYTKDGFIIYNDTKVTIPSEYNSNKVISNYPEGKFNVAMAFEYGTGIVGLTNPVTGHWEYNVNDYNNAWYYKDENGKHATFGSRGYEFYRFTAIEINKNLKTWINEYLNKGM